MESTDLDMAEIFDDREENEDVGALQETDDTQNATQENEDEDDAGKMTICCFFLKNTGNYKSKPFRHRPESLKGNLLTDFWTTSVHHFNQYGFNPNHMPYPIGNITW